MWGIEWDLCGALKEKGWKQYLCSHVGTRADHIRVSMLAHPSRIRTWFQLVDPCACNTDHTSIHCKWTSILVINTSRLSSLQFSSPFPPAFNFCLSLWVHWSTHPFHFHSLRLSLSLLHGCTSIGTYWLWSAVQGF